MKTTLVLALTLGTLFHAFAATTPESAKIDTILAKDYAKLKLQPNPASSDEAFVRRIYLDVVGRIPSIPEAQAFLASTDANKRAALIDQLLASDGYASHFFNYWADVLRLQTDTKGKLTGEAYAQWLKDALKKNQPFDGLVRELVTTDGAAWDSGAIGFYMRDQGMPLDHLAATVQIFLGTQIVCAQCHNHPFDKWTQMDYYHMASYTYGVNAKSYGVELAGMVKKPKGGKDRKKMSSEEREKAAAQQAIMKEISEPLKDVMKSLRYTNIKETDALPKLPHDYKYPDAKPLETVQPRTLFGHDAIPAVGESRTDAFAKWMTSPDNARFTIVVANRLWKQAMGLALIEPLDEMTDSTVPSNPELMDYLVQVMQDKKYDMKAYLRVIYNSDTYQRAATTTGPALGERYAFTGPLLRRMTSEQVWDSMVTLLTGNPDDGIGSRGDAIENRLSTLEKLYDTLASKTPEDLVAAVRASSIGDKKGTEAKANQLRKDLVAAREAKKDDEVKRLSKELKELQGAQQKGSFLAILGEDLARELRRGGGDVPKNAAKKVSITKPGGKEQMREEMKKLQAQGLDKAAMQKKIAEFKAQAAALRKAKDNLPTLTRASEAGSPAPRGHLLRLFGQSDRETIENASSEATVPQALGLLNGSMADAIFSPGSHFREEVHNASTHDQATQIYLGLLSRHPTADESKLIASIQAERGDKAMSDLVRALLNTSQFLFVQ